MKKIIFFSIVFFTIISINATDINYTVPVKTEKKFLTDFPDATEISWKEKNGLNIAVFRKENKNYYAYYNSESELVSVARYIAIESIPLKIQWSIKSKFDIPENFRLMEVSEISGDIFYLATVNSGGRAKNIKVYTNCDLEILK
jgi:hypothetical protein